MNDSATPRISSPQDFKSKSRGALLELPSGLTVRGRRVNIRAFLSSGDIPNPLIPIVQKALDRGTTNQQDVVKALQDENGEFDLALLGEMYGMIDQLVCSSITEPKIHPAPVDESGSVIDYDSRPDDDKVWIEDIEDDDKMFIYQWTVGGTADLATFRREAQETLAAMVEGASGVDSTESPAGSEA